MKLKILIKLDSEFISLIKKEKYLFFISGSIFKKKFNKNSLELIGGEEIFKIGKAILEFEEYYFKINSLFKNF